jgi:hypothetical protein
MDLLPWSIQERLSAEAKEFVAQIKAVYEQV